MRVPTTIDGLRKVLRSLGFGDVVTGIDVADPAAKQHLMDQIAWKFEQSSQTMQDDARRKKALSYVKRFPWGNMSDVSLCGALSALSDLAALLDEEMVLEPVEVEEYIDDDEDGETEAILIQRAALALEAAQITLAPELSLPDFPGLPDLVELAKKMKNKLLPKQRIIKYMGKRIPVQPWADLGDTDAWEDDTEMVIVASDFTWYGPYVSPATATRSAWHISTKGDNQKQRVPLAKLMLVREQDWPPAKATGSSMSKMHKLAAKLSDWRGNWFHFSDFEMLKVNVKQHHQDPAGIYLFPERFNDRSAMWEKLRYQYVVKLKPSAKVLDLATLTSAQALELSQALGGDPKMHSAEDILSSQPEKAIDLVWEDLVQRFMGKPGAWNKALRKLGYDAVFDDTGSIHNAEVQLLVLNPKAVVVLDRVDLNQKKGSGFRDVKQAATELASALKALGSVTVKGPRVAGNGRSKKLQAEVVVKDGEKYAAFTLVAEPTDGEVYVDLSYSNPSKLTGLSSRYGMTSKRWTSSWRGHGLDIFVTELTELFSEGQKAAASVQAGLIKSSRTTYYHGGAKRYDRLRPGDGVDGKGIYLTSDLKRAEMYGKRDTSGKDRAAHITEVAIDLSRIKVWDYGETFDLRDFSSASWVDDLIKKHGEKSVLMNGENARIYLFGNDNTGIKKLGYKAIKKPLFGNKHDLIVLDDSIIQRRGPGGPHGRHLPRQQADLDPVTQQRASDGALTAAVKVLNPKGELQMTRQAGLIKSSFDWRAQEVHVMGKDFRLGDLHGGKLYHGSPHKLTVGTVLTPQTKKNYKQSGNAVSITSNAARAAHWGSVGGVPYVYEVEPLSDVDVWRAGLVAGATAFELWEGRVAKAKILSVLRNIPSS